MRSLRASPSLRIARALLTRRSLRLKYAPSWEINEYCLCCVIVEICYAPYVANLGRAYDSNMKATVNVGLGLIYA